MHLVLVSLCVCVCWVQRAIAIAAQQQQGLEEVDGRGWLVAGARLMHGRIVPQLAQAVSILNLTACC